jgi:probable HAF family extracellular repeat protein
VQTAPCSSHAAAVRRNGCSGYEGFLYSGGSLTLFADPSAANFTIPLSINASGQIVGYYLDNSNIQHGFLYSGGSYITIDDPLATHGTTPLSISASGQIVGNYIDSRTTPPIRYSPGALRTAAR